MTGRSRRHSLCEMAKYVLSMKYFPLPLCYNKCEKRFLISIQET
jgi:hypothetical protein